MKRASNNNSGNINSGKLNTSGNDVKISSSYQPKTDSKGFVVVGKPKKVEQPKQTKK